MAVSYGGSWHMFSAGFFFGAQSAQCPAIFVFGSNQQLVWVIIIHLAPPLTFPLVAEEKVTYFSYTQFLGSIALPKMKG